MCTNIVGWLLEVKKTNCTIAPSAQKPSKEPISLKSILNFTSRKVRKAGQYIRTCPTQPPCYLWHQ